MLHFLFQPERINPDLNQKGYSVKSDIWSLGITMVSMVGSQNVCLNTICGILGQLIHVSLLLYSCYLI